MSLKKWMDHRKAELERRGFGKSKKDEKPDDLDKVEYEMDEEEHAKKGKNHEHA